jgi:hypothetical protein
LPAFFFAQLPAEQAGTLLRRAFPLFYLWVIVLAGAAALLQLGIDATSAAWLAGVAITTLPARQLLMPAINAASDAGDKARFNRLHGVSVALGLLQIVAVGYVLIRIF